MTPLPPGRSLELYFIDGRPDGMLTAEVFGWTGHLLVTPRTQLKAALARPEAAHTGVYLLLGEREGQPLAYVGEAEDIATRIKTHDAKKDWWTRAVLITSAANKLNKAHVKYLEARLIAHANKAAQTALENSSTPTQPGLSEADRANMEAFLDNVLMVLPALRVDLFMSSAGPAQLKGGGAVRFELVSKKHGLKATAVQIEGEFVVEAGSMARMTWEGIGSETSGYARLHDQLCKGGILVPNGANRRFSANTSFNSPSAASAVVFGRPSNGTLEWKLEGSSMTYKQWEAGQLGVPAEAT